MDIRPIKTEEDHAAALAEIAALWNAEEGSAEWGRLDGLATLIDAYEGRIKRHQRDRLGQGESRAVHGREPAKVES